MVSSCAAAASAKLLLPCIAAGTTRGGGHICFIQCSAIDGAFVHCYLCRGGTGEPTDYYLYVTAADSTCSSSVAWATYCLQDSTTNQPRIGTANFCPSAASLLSTDPESAIAVLMHEMVHALVRAAVTKLGCGSCLQDGSLVLFVRRAGLIFLSSLVEWRGPLLRGCTLT